jgi:Transcriptional regulators
MTIREIAQICGVSRGTVDRVINGRGKVHPETEKRIMEALEKAGYQKNILGRALTVRKLNPIIGVVLSSEGNPFFEDVLLGIKKAETELMDYGIKVRLLPMRGYKKLKQLELIESVESEIAALVLHPINDKLIIDKVNQLHEKGIPTITVNSDIEGSARLCYVGSDYEKGGKTAAGIVRLVTGGKARLGIVMGVASVLGHRQRLEGFVSHIKAACPGIEIDGMVSAQDDDEIAYKATMELLKKRKKIDTMMVIAAGMEGVCRAVKEINKDREISIFGFDDTPATKRGMADGMIKAVICQQPLEQGYRGVKAAFDWILTGAVSGERVIMENQIRITENINELEGK